MTRSDQGWIFSENVAGCFKKHLQRICSFPVSNCQYYCESLFEWQVTPVSWPRPLWYPAIWIGRFARIEILFIFANALQRKEKEIFFSLQWLSFNGFCRTRAMWIVNLIYMSHVSSQVKENTIFLGTQKISAILMLLFQKDSLDTFGFRTFRRGFWDS